MERELIQPSVAGEVTPGSTVGGNPTVKNSGTKQCLAFVKVEMPVYGSGSPAYTFSPDSWWSKVADDGATVVYGYGAILSPDEETASALCESMTIVEISGSEFLNLSDVNVRLTGYLADCGEYREDPVSA